MAWIERFRSAALFSQRKRLLIYSLLLLAALGAIWAAVFALFPSPPKSITFAAGPKGGAFEDSVQRYVQRLAKHGVAVRVVHTTGMAENLKLLSEVDAQADVTIVFGGVASQQEKEHVISIGRVSAFPIWFFHRTSENLDGIASFRGKRIAIGPASRAFIEPLLAHYGIDATNTDFRYIPGSAAALALQKGEIDVAPLPFELASPAVQSLLRDPGITLANMREADAIVRLHPYLAKMTLPRGVVDLSAVIPKEDVVLVGISNAVVVQPKLHPEIIFRLARVLAEEHGKPGIFQQVGEFPTRTDPEFRFADSALSYYRNGLPALNAYLPFWVQQYAKQLLAFTVAVLGILLPALHFLSIAHQKLIDFRLRRLLTMVDESIARLDAAQTAQDIDRIEADMRSGKQLFARLPISHRYTSMHEGLISRMETFEKRIAVSKSRR